ncbi:MAG: transcriptional regulator [Patulibacter minatonensis]
MAALDPALVAPARLQLMSLAAATSKIEFATLREAVGVSDSVLSKHLAALAAEGYLTSTKGVHAGRRTTWVALTPEGRGALSAHVAELRRITAGIE